MQAESEQYLTVLLNSAGGPLSHAGEYQIAVTARFSKKIKLSFIFRSGDFVKSSP